MKKLILVSYILFFAMISQAQDLAGKWNGTLEFGGKKVVFVFDIVLQEGVYSTTMAIPSKRIENLKPSKTQVSEGKLLIDGSNLGIKYEGKFDVKTQEIVGNMSEGPSSFPLVLRRGLVQAEFTKKRPQEPVKPYPYHEEQVVFENKEAGISLAGTLTLPSKEGKYPVVILISGSGPQDRDETFKEHKPFWVLADYLTRQGIAVLRYDDRGTAASTGNFAKATTEDFAKDVMSAIHFLKTRKDIDKKKIGLIGHSEGGIIAPFVANRSKDVAFIVNLAGTGIIGSDLITMQVMAMKGFPVPDEAEFERNVRKSIEIASQDKEINTIKQELVVHYNKTLKPILLPLVGAEEKVDEMIIQFSEARTRPWMRYFYQYNPANEYEKIKCPVLSLNGSLDTQVVAKVNQNGIKKALAKSGNKDYLVKEMQGMNHLFQECKLGTMDEYDDIEQTMSPIALKEISDWILARVK